MCSAWHTDALMSAWPKSTLFMLPSLVYLAYAYGFYHIMKLLKNCQYENENQNAIVHHCFRMSAVEFR
jgi:hypothetical protein